jgi:hypothetical protein
MKRATYDAYLADPSAVLEEVARKARRERSRAVHRFILAPLAAFWKAR